MSGSTTLNSIGGRSRHKSSPKRKIANPQHVVLTSDHVIDDDAEDDDDVDADDDAAVDDDHVRRVAADTSDDKVLTLIEYNDVTHGYDCMQCDFASHDLSVMKDHARDEHLAGNGDRLKCDHCHLTFSQEFNLRIHARKHETSNQVQNFNILIDQ